MDMAAENFVTEVARDRAEDSGIDSEEQHDSPSPSNPLELVIKKKSPAPKRHWKKKFLTDQAVENAHQVAQVLLSLGQDRHGAVDRQNPSWTSKKSPTEEQNEPENLSVRPAEFRLGFSSVALPLRPLPINRLPTAPSPLISATSKPFHCAECRKSFSTQSGHTKHMLLHAGNLIAKSFSCKSCGKVYTSLSALKMHLRTHTLPCRCDVCGKSFSRPWLLQGHVRTHTGDKPFACGCCARTFADKSNLRAHLQTHLRTKRHCCAGCRRTFSRVSLLNKHADGGCAGLMRTRDEECVKTLVGLASGELIRI